MKQEKDFEAKDDFSEKSGKGNKSNRRNNKNKDKGNSKPIKSGRTSSAALQNNEQICKAAASIPYFKALGRPVGFSKSNPYNEYVTYSEQVFPGIMRLDYVPGPGVSTAQTDPINMASDSVYSFIRHMNSGAANYDSNDLMLYLLAAAEAYIYWSMGARALGLINVYDQTNGYLPKALVKVAGFDFDDLMANQTKFRGMLNTTAALLSSYCVPDIFPYYRREIDMASLVFTDRDVLKPQIYLFKPSIVREYDEATEETGAVLTAHSVGNNLTVDQWATRMNSIITKFRRSEDIGIMSGDILKAYGRENLITMPVIDESHVVFPIYDEEWLLQIHNAKILSTEPDIDAHQTSLFNIHSDVDTGLVKYMPYIVTNNCAQTPNFIDVRKDDPTPSDTLHATRLMPVCNYGIALDPTSNKRVWSILYAGLEIVINAATFALDKDTGELMDVSYAVCSWNDQANTETDFTRIDKLSKFNWAPIVYTGTVENVLTDHPHYTVLHQVGEVANYAIISDNNLEEMHRAEVLEAFRIPYNGSY